MKRKTQIEQEVEFPVLKTTSLVIGIASLMAIVLNALLELSSSLNYATIVAAVIFMLIYWAARLELFSGILKTVFLTSSLIFINIAWFYNYGFSSAVTIFFVIWFTFMALVSTPRTILFWIGIIIPDIVILLIFQLKFPETLGQYANLKAQTIDSFYSLIIAMIVVFFFISNSKRKYLRQYWNAKKSEQLKNSFLANISHEIRTPLNSIVGFSDLLMDPDERDELDTRLKIINDNSEYLLALIEDVLDLARIETGELNIIKEEGNIINLIEKLIIEYMIRIEDQCPNKIDLEFFKTGGSGQINTDLRRVEQVMRNLLDNALKFTKSGYIHIYHSQDNTQMTITVQDTGIGIPEKDLHTVFKRFVKIEHDLSKQYRGVGIGLALSKQLIEAMDGQISAVSMQGKGTAFTFALPFNRSS